MMLCSNLCSVQALSGRYRRGELYLRWHGSRKAFICIRGPTRDRTPALCALIREHEDVAATLSAFTDGSHLLEEFTLAEPAL